MSSLKQPLISYKQAQINQLKTLDLDLSDLDSTPNFSDSSIKKSKQYLKKKKEETTKNEVQ